MKHTDKPYDQVTTFTVNQYLPLEVHYSINCELDDDNSNYIYTFIKQIYLDEVPIINILNDNIMDQIKRYVDDQAWEILATEDNT